MVEINKYFRKYLQGTKVLEGQIFNYQNPGHAVEDRYGRMGKREINISS
jgi:hypothetical protein